MDRMLDTEHLVNFLHIIDSGTLSAAALRAHLSQPALSRQMSLLEQEVGAELFVRTGRGMRPTLDGKRLETRARPLLKQLDSLGREFSSAPIAGPLSLAVTPSIGMAWSAEVIERFRKSYPEAELRVAVVLSGEMGGAVARGKYDLGVLFSPLDGAHLVVETLWEEVTYLMCKPGSKWARRAQVSLREALGSPLLLPSSEHGVRELLEQKARELQQPLHMEMQVDSVQLALQLVKRGVGYLVLTERALADATAARLSAVPIRRPTLKRTAQLIGTEASLRRPVVRALFEAILESGAALSGGNGPSRRVGSSGAGGAAKR